MTLPLTGRPDHRGGLWTKVKDGDGCVHDGAWRTAMALLEHVGTCRRCGQPLKPREPERLPGGRWQYPAVCTGAGCDYDTAAHGPRPAKKETKR